MKDDLRRGERSLFPTIPIYFQFIQRRWSIRSFRKSSLLSRISSRGTRHRELSTVVQIREDYRLKMFHEIRAPSSRLLSCATAMWFFSTGGGREAAIFRLPRVTYSEKCVTFVHSKAVSKRYCRLLGFEVNCVSLGISVFFFFFFGWLT